MSFSEKHLKSLIKLAVQNQASDIHIRTDEPPSLRIRGDLIQIQSREFSQEDMEAIVQILADKHDNINTRGVLEIDGVYQVPDLCRVRYNIFKYSKKVGAILRVVKQEIPSLDDLGLSKTLKDIALQKRGLVLITGATGSGKSTTMAAMIKHINENRFCHIVTVEDPIEYLHPQNKSKISQREIGQDTEDYSQALRAALRQDPDVILIGEMRDTQTIKTALRAAETGHLVMSTLHTTNVVTTLGRIISMFPPEEQTEVRKRLSESLYATVGQRMLKGKEKDSIVVAQEIMTIDPGVKECILGQEPLSRINTIVAKGFNKSDNPTQTFDQHLLKLYEDGMISRETALTSAESQSDFLQKLNFE